MVFTDHKRQTSSYWTNTVATKVEQNTTINGLVNTSRLDKFNWYMTSVPLVAWADWNNTGLTADPKRNWIWILDRQGGDPANRGTVLSLVNEWTYLMDRNVDIYIRSCWNIPKIAGTYYARVYFSLDTQ